MAGFEGGAEEMFESLREQMNAPAEFPFQLHVDQFDMRHLKPADAAWEVEEGIGGWRGGRRQ